MRLFHVSYRDHGPSVLLKPRVPESLGHGEDSKVKRVCAATRVGDCLRMFPWEDGRQKVHVYALDLKRLPAVSRTLPRRYVPDWRKWGREEVWLLEKKGYEFRRLGFAQMFRVEMLTGQPFWRWRLGGPAGVVDPQEMTKVDEAKTVAMWLQFKRQERQFRRETQERNRVARGREAASA